MKKRILSFALSLSLLAALLPGAALAASAQDDRTVWLHAQGTNPQTTVNLTTAYLSDAVNVYFAIDDPNRGAFDGTTHSEAWNDLNGYTVKIWYDPYYLQPAVSGGELDYTVPTNAYESGDYSGSFDDVGYYVYRNRSGAAVIDGRSYRYASVTVFYSGFWLPQKADSALWYNLARLPLKAVHTGGTDVWIETDEAIDPVNVTDALELFAKNESGDYDATFRCSTVNGGYHHINIVEKAKPAPPVATPSAGTYTSAQTVALTAEDDCDVWYSLDNVTFQKYTAPISVPYTQTVRAFAERVSDGKRSNTVSYIYNIIPEPPRLFETDGGAMTAIENAHYESNPFTVYAAVGDTYAPIPDGSAVYYTFSETLDADEIAAHIGSDPETSWVAVPAAAPKVGDNPADTVTARHTVRLVTVMGAERSDVNWYYLGIRPAPVTFAPGFGVKTEPSVTVTMQSDTTGAAIFYTTDGSDPRASAAAQAYDAAARPVYAADVSVRAAAQYDGVWSEPSGTWYIFETRDDFGVTPFYPPGVYEGPVSVTLTPQNSDYTVQYATDGVTWEDYDESLEIDSDADLYVRTVDPASGAVGPAYGPLRYTIRPKPPIFAPGSAQFSASDEITVYCGSDRTDANGDRFLLYYTTDGTDPTVSGTRVQADAASDSAVLPITKYTVVRAAVQRDGATWSSVVTNAYDVVSGKATAPLVTLTPGYYTLSAGQEPYTTRFFPVPGGTTIYYTTDSSMPDVNDPAQAYTPGEEIPVQGHEVIKAVAVNALGYKSDVVIFDYTVTPSAPVAAPSAVLDGGSLPLVPVTAVEDSEVTYTVNGEEWRFDNSGGADFYIDAATGVAYRDAARTQPLVDVATAKTFTEQATLSLRSKLDGVESPQNHYVYRVRDDGATLAPPWADRATGTYEERALDAENTLLNVRLDHLNRAGTIQYRLNNGAWRDYDGAIRLYYKPDGLTAADDSPIQSGGTAVLQARVKNGGRYSDTVSYVYNFVPTPPVISLPSGRYSYMPDEDGNLVYPATTLALAADAPDAAGLYDIYYRANGDANDFRYTGARRSIDHTMSFRAYTVNNVTGRLSGNTVHYYIIETPSAASGTVYTVFPYEVLSGDRLDVAAHRLDDPYYNEGIRLRTQLRDADIRYYYTWRGADDQSYTTSTMTYDPAMPIFVNNSMSEIVVTAWLEDGGTKVDGSDAVFAYRFIDLPVPVTSLGESREVSRGTAYTIINDCPDDEHMFIYYTLDGSDPTVSAARALCQGETLTVNGTTVVRAAYYRACGRCAACKAGRPLECLNGLYGEVGTYRYTVPTVTGGGGGGSAAPAPCHVDAQSGDEGAVETDLSVARPGDTVTVTAMPSPGYRVASLSVTTESGVRVPATVGGDGRYRFTMQGENVTVRAVFVEDVAPLDETHVDALLNAEDHVAYFIGYTDGTVRPLGSIARCEVAMILYRLLLRHDTERAVHFTDVPEGAWYAEAVSTLAGLGVITGYTDGTFRPYDPIRRAEFTAMAVRFARSLGGTASFRDVPENYWAAKEIAAAVSYGWIRGYGDDTFGPEREIARCEAAKVLNRMLVRSADQAYVTAHFAELAQFSDLQNRGEWYFYDMVEATNAHDCHREDEAEVWDGTR